MYREHVQKSLNVYDTWFGFYIHFKKALLNYHMVTTGENGLNSYLNISVFTSHSIDPGRDVIIAI